MYPRRKRWGGTLVLWRSRVCHFSGLIHNTSWPSPPRHAHTHTQYHYSTEAVWGLQSGVHLRWLSYRNKPLTRHQLVLQLFYCSQMAADTVEPQKKIKSSHLVDRDRQSPLLASKVVDWEHSPFLCSTLCSSATTVQSTAVVVKVLNNVKHWLKEAKLGQSGMSAPHSVSTGGQFAFSSYCLPLTSPTVRWADAKSVSQNSAYPAANDTEAGTFIYRWKMSCQVNTAFKNKGLQTAILKNLRNHMKPTVKCLHDQKHTLGDEWQKNSSVCDCTVKHKAAPRCYTALLGCLFI